jgi:tetratricopeptide (TPR) repeat protein
MWRLVAITAAVLLGPRAASAGEATEPSQEARAEAARLFALGGTHFNLAEYDEAIAAFKEGYRRSPEPAFLYNLGQAYRLQGSCRAAARMYASYLRLRPDDPRHAMIAGQQADMESCGRGQRRHDVDHASTRRVQRRAGIGLIGAGVVAAGMGAYFAMDEPDEPDGRKAEEHRSQMRSVSMFAAGGFLMLAGGVLCYLGREPPAPAGAALSIDVRPGSRTVAATWRF